MLEWAIDFFQDKIKVPQYMYRILIRYLIQFRNEKNYAIHESFTNLNFQNKKKIIWLVAILRMSYEFFLR